MGRVDEALKIRWRTKPRVQLVPRPVLVPVVRRRREHRLQVDHRHAQPLQVIEGRGGREPAEVAEAGLGRALRVVVRVAPRDGHDLVNDLILRRARELGHARPLHEERGHKSSDEGKLCEPRGALGHLTPFRPRRLTTQTGCTSPTTRRIIGDGREETRSEGLEPGGGEGIVSRRKQRSNFYTKWVALGHAQALTGVWTTSPTSVAKSQRVKSWHKLSQSG